jgi:hypothetical protein
VAFHRGLLGWEFEDGPSRRLLALFDRAQARDLVDVAALVDRFGLEPRCEREGRSVLGPSRDARPTNQV